MGFGFKQPLVGEKRCVTTLITAAEETISLIECFKHSLIPRDLQRLKIIMNSRERKEDSSVIVFPS